MVTSFDSVTKPGNRSRVFRSSNVCLELMAIVDINNIGQSTTTFLCSGITYAVLKNNVVSTMAFQNAVNICGFFTGVNLIQLKKDENVS